jgi:hypothetical protein
MYTYPSHLKFNFGWLSKVFPCVCVCVCVCARAVDCDDGTLLSCVASLLSLPHSYSEVLLHKLVPEAFCERSHLRPSDCHRKSSPLTRQRMEETTAKRDLVTTESHSYCLEPPLIPGVAPQAARTCLRTGHVVV